MCAMHVENSLRIMYSWWSMVPKSYCCGASQQSRASTEMQYSVMRFLPSVWLGQALTLLIAMSPYCSDLPTQAGDR